MQKRKSWLSRQLSFSRLLISLKKKAPIRALIDPAWRRQEYHFRWAWRGIQVDLPQLAGRPFQPGKSTLSPSLATVAASLDFELTSHSSVENKEGIVLCTVCVGDQYQRRMQPCLDSRRRYCERHGYDLALLKISPAHFDRAAAWLKITLLYRLFSEGKKRVFALDADALITNHSVPLETFFEEMAQTDKSFCIGYENPHNKRHVCLNTGGFLLRANEATQSLLQMIWECPMYRHSGCWEQSALMDLYQRFAGLQEITLIQKQRRFNSFLPGQDVPSDDYHWRPDDFVLHFCGQRGEDLDQTIQDYLKYS